MATTSVMWFRRDLRLADNEALCAAAKSGRVTPLFVIDPTLFERAGAPRVAFMLRNLRALNDSMGGALVVVAMVTQPVASQRVMPNRARDGG